LLWLPLRLPGLSLDRANLFSFQAVAEHYSGGSTPFGEIAGLSGPPYNRPTLVEDSPSGSG